MSVLLCSAYNAVWEPNSECHCTRQCLNIFAVMLLKDVIWCSKCSRHGWFLPYDPPPYEYGAWKRHYIACIYSLDMELSSRTIATAETVTVLCAYVESNTVTLP